MKRQEFKNLIRRELIKEAKGTSYEAKLAEIEKQGHITTLEAKIDALAEMIETKNNRLSLVSEDENLSELIDKKKIREMQKEIKLLEKTKLKLEKLYEKKSGGRKKEVVVDEDNDMDLSDINDAESELKTGSQEDHDEKEDVDEGVGSTYEENDLRGIDGYGDNIDNGGTISSREWEYDEDEDETMNEEFLRMQKLAGIITESSLNEAAGENLELKSLAKKLYLGFKKMGADVELTTTLMRLNKAPSGDLDEKNVWIYAGDDHITVQLVGEKAGGFFGKIQKDFPDFEFKDKGDSKSWEDKNIKNLQITPGKGMSE